MGDVEVADDATDDEIRSAITMAIWGMFNITRRVHWELNVGGYCGDLDTDILDESANGVITTAISAAIWAMFNITYGPV